jgi:hypothetical protein
MTRTQGRFRLSILAFLASAVICVTAAPPVFSAGTDPQETPKKPAAASFALSAAPSNVKIDGVLDEEAWQKAAVMKLLYEWTPGDNVPPPVDTDCLVTYDRDKFYIAFRCFDPEPKKIRAHLMDRDATDTLIQDDHISVIIDPFNDERRGFQFRVNPLGVQADANFSESEGYEDFSWDAIWSAAGKISDWGYAIEIAIPFNQLRFPKGTASQTWGISAERSWPRNVRHRMTSHRRDRDVACILCQFNKLTGIEGITPGRNLEFDPTLTANRTDVRNDFPAGPMEAGKIKAEPGITARWGVTPNLILNATANPDFSQVEADVAQLEVNTRFALFYPEKRPFFLEGGDFFLTPLQAVFTRTVADPAGGVKMTGKIGRSAIGFFGAYDRINNLIFPSNQGSASDSLDQDVASGVFRYRRDVGRNSTIGVLYTGRAAEDYYNHVLGFDGFLQLSRVKSLYFQYLHTETEYPLSLARRYGQPEKPFGGNGATIGLQHASRDWVYYLGLNALSANFRADYGFVPQVDFRQVQANAIRVLWGKPNGWFTQILVGFQGYRTESIKGRMTDQLIGFYARYEGPYQSTLQVVAGPSKEYYEGRVYDLTRFRLAAEMKPFSGAVFQLGARFEDGIDYANSRKADVLNITPALEYNFSRHFNFNLAHVFERLSFGGRKIYTANLLQGKLVYNFNVRTFVRAIVQYQNLVRDPELYGFPVAKTSDSIFTQFLFSYKINPQTVLFLGYSDNYLGMQGIDITRADRTFFVKLGYAWTQ